jgi:uncharacterized membrane protein YdjX (TVP38/TMEM64 family)
VRRYNWPLSISERRVDVGCKLVKMMVRACTSWLRQRWPWVLAVVLLIGLAFWLGPHIWQLARDEAVLQAAIAELGWLGPLALIMINVLQIVIAPIPGYVMQAAAGYLYGPFWGGVWGSIGLLAGSMLAMGLARTFGRPLAERLVGAQRLEHWESITHSTNTLVWFTILAAPTGDLPYFLAGLAHVSYWKIFALTLLIRVPATFVVAAVGAGMWSVTGWQMAGGIIALGALLVLFYTYRQRLVALLDRLVQRRLTEQEP